MPIGVICLRVCLFVEITFDTDQIKTKETRKQSIYAQNPKFATWFTNICKRHKKYVKTMLKLLYQRLSMSSFFLHFGIPLRGNGCLSSLCGQEFLLNAYRVSVLLLSGGCLKVYRVQKILLVLRLHSCRAVLTCGDTLAAPAVLFSGVSPEFPLRI